MKKIQPKGLVKLNQFIEFNFFSCVLYYIYFSMDNDLNERLGKIVIEYNFFVLFIFLIVLAFIANNYEKNYFIYKDDDDKKKYYYLQVFIFSMVY